MTSISRSACTPNGAGGKSEIVAEIRRHDGEMSGRGNEVKSAASWAAIRLRHGRTNFRMRELAGETFIRWEISACGGGDGKDITAFVLFVTGVSSQPFPGDLVAGCSFR